MGGGKCLVSGNNMTFIDFLSSLRDLSRRRPVFHSEADFQLALAWHIHETKVNSQVRLEFKPFQSENMYLDIWLQTSEAAIELKYPTQELKVEREGEVFALRNQSAQDTRRYDFITDIRRLERVVYDSALAKVGFAVLLTNDPSYWEPPQQGWEDTTDAAFRIHEGSVIKGEMDWSGGTSEGTKKGKEKPIRLGGYYDVNWQDYSTLKEEKYGKFRYLAVQVPHLKT